MGKLKVDSTTLKGAAVLGGGAVLFVALILFSSFNIASLVLYLRPGDYLRAAIAPLLFDGAALVWLGMFVWNARGGAQRLIALVWCFVSVIAIAAANLYYLDLTSSANTLSTIERQEAVRWALRSIEYAVVWHLVGKFVYFVFNPSIVATMKEYQRQFRVMVRAQELADERIDEIAEQAAERIAVTTRRAALETLSQATGTNLLDLAGTARYIAPVVTKQVKEPVVVHGSNGHAGEERVGFTPPPS